MTYQLPVCLQDRLSEWLEGPWRPGKWRYLLCAVCQSSTRRSHWSYASWHRWSPLSVCYSWCKLSTLPVLIMQDISWWVSSSCLALILICHPVIFLSSAYTTGPFRSCNPTLGKSPILVPQASSDNHSCAELALYCVLRMIFRISKFYLV